MKEETRFRVTGSLFLLALAVIFLPMLFDGAGLATVELPPVTVPVMDGAEIPDTPSVDELVTATEQLRADIDEQGFVRANDTRLGEPVLSRVDDETRAFAVQIASFADLGNAQVFLQRIRDDGYEAFLSTIRASGEMRTRVAVGPLLNQKEAEALQGELSSRYRVNAQLMAFSN